MEQEGSFHLLKAIAKMKTILFGNGLNYLSEDFITWKQLLDKIKGDNLFENGQLPNTMIYERSIIGNPISFDTLTQKEEAIKIEIAEMLENFPSNPYYEKLSKIRAENCLTTNYDYAFLKHFQETTGFKIVNKSTEGIYSVRRYKEVLTNGKVSHRVWHIHGEIDSPPSIMLGLDHYCGSVAKISSYVKGGYEFQLDKKPQKPRAIIDKLRLKEFDGTSWIELLFNSDVHIIGLGLDFSEIDLWWILNKRARFKLDNQTNNLVKNTIFFYSTEEKRDQLDLLKSLQIEIVEIKMDDSKEKYHKAYDKILKLIDNQ